MMDDGMEQFNAIPIDQQPGNSLQDARMHLSNLRAIDPTDVSEDDLLHFPERLANKFNEYLDFDERHDFNQHLEFHDDNEVNEHPVLNEYRKFKEADVYDNSDHYNEDSGEHEESVSLTAKPSPANNDNKQAATDGRQNVGGRYRLAIAVTGCLWIAALSGYLWSLSIHGKRDDAGLQNTMVKATLPDPAGTPKYQIETAMQMPAEFESLSTTTNDDVKDSEPTYSEEEYLEEIEWLSNQNRSLKSEVSELRQESKTLNDEVLQLDNQLLQLELEVVSLKFQLEKASETRVIYNFVDVPIGSEQSFQSSNRFPLTNKNRTADDRDVSGANEEPRVPFNNSIPDPEFMESDERYDSSYDKYVNDEGQFMEEEFLEDQRDLYNGGEPTNTEPVYDPETGLEISDPYIAKETQYKVDGID